MKILISAAETSSDAHGAELLKALRAEAERRGQALEAFGIGGPLLQQSGLRAIVDSRELLVMGFTEILGRLPRILSALGRLTRAGLEERPDAVVVIDYPDFHLKLARRLGSTGVPMVYYIPPKVWVWRKGRVELLKKLFRRVLCIFPFEEAFYRGTGVAARYVGNPLLDELPLGMTRAEARAALGIAEGEKALVLMPGSRASELKHHVPLMLDAAVRAAARLRASGWLGKDERLRVLVPFPVTADFVACAERVRRWDSYAILDLTTLKGRSAEALRAADAGLIKSGTSTLEAALLDCPQAVVYRPSRVSQFIFEKLIRYRGPVGLVNLVTGRRARAEYVADELLCSEATVARLADAVVRLLTDEGARARMAGEYAELRRELQAGADEAGPSARAAREILDVVGEAGGKPSWPAS